MNKGSIGNVLITGGCGFVGANLIAFLKNAGGVNSIRVLDNETTSSFKSIEGFDVDFIRGDIRSKEDLTRALDGIDVVVHLAADTRVVDSIESPDFNFDVNVVGTLNLLQQMKALGIKRMINASTGGAIIGEVEPPVKEDMVPRPASPYGASKAAVEAYCSAYAQSYDMKIVSLRFSNVFGPRSFHKGSVVAAFFKNIMKGETCVIYGDGKQTRDYIFVEDLCRGIVDVMQSDLSGVYQLGTGVGTSLIELLSKINLVVGDKYKIEVEHREARAGEVIFNYADISKAKEHFKFSPSENMMDGLKITWKWFQENQ